MKPRIVVPAAQVSLAAIAVTLALLLGSTAPAEAAIVTLDATIDPAQAGGGARTGFGTGRFTLDTVAQTLSYNISFSGLSGTATSVQLHGPAAPGMSANSNYTLLPLGSPMTGTVNLVAIGSYTVAQQMADLQAGLWYVMIHSTTFGGGEIRGQIVRSVGGIAELADVDDPPPLAQPDSSDSNAGVMVGIAAGAAAFAVTMGGAVVYARRRWLR